LRDSDGLFYAWGFFGLVNTFIQSKHGLNQDNAVVARAVVELFLCGAGRCSSA
jgi:hypothetical protein